MIPVTRIGDMSAGICSVGALCCPHGWISIHMTGSPIDHASGRKILRIGDMGASTCPHCPISYAITGAAVDHEDEIPTHRLGDVHNVPCGPGSVISADPVTHAS